MDFYNYITILTPDNIEIKYRLAGLGSRLAAAILDILIQGVAIIAVTAAYVFYFVKSLRTGMFNDIMLGIFIVFLFAFSFGYYLLFELFMKGKTPGKHLFKLRVIRENGQPAGFSHILIRTLLKFVDFFGIGSLLIWFSKKNSRLGDMAASTVVIAENFENNLDDLMPKLDAGEKNIAAYSHLMLKKRELDILTDYFNRKSEFSDGGEMLKIRICRYFAEKFGIPEGNVTEDMLYELMKLNR